MIYYLLETAAAWPDMALGRCPPGLLTEAEQAEYAALATSKRRRDWLLGRGTAKQLLRGMVQAGGHAAPSPDRLAIGRWPDGAPYATWPGRVDPWPLSISHSEGRAACATTEDATQVLGIDLERIAPRSAAFAQDYLTQAEISCVERAPHTARETLVTAIWSAKEAALKALHLGLTVDTRSVECLIEPPAATPERWTPLAVTLDPERLKRPAPPLAGWWQLNMGWVVTLVIQRFPFGSSVGVPHDLAGD